MRILLLVHAFNSLSQRLYVELARDGHELSVELDIHDRVTCEAVDLFRPDRDSCPVSEARHSAVGLAATSLSHRASRAARRSRPVGARLGDPARCGPPGASPSCRPKRELDAGPVWASASFPMRTARKSSLYRNEVTEGAVVAVRAALARVAAGTGPPSEPGASSAHGWQPPLRQAQRAIDWSRDDTATVLRKIHSADGFPGVEDLLFNRRFRLFDAHPEARLAGRPGMLIARRHDAICRATRDGAVWIGQLQPVDGRAAQLQASRGTRARRPGGSLAAQR